MVLNTACEAGLESAQILLQEKVSDLHLNQKVRPLEQIESQAKKNTIDALPVEQMHLRRKAACRT